MKRLSAGGRLYKTRIIWAAGTSLLSIHACSVSTDHGVNARGGQAGEAAGGHGGGANGGASAQGGRMSGGSAGALAVGGSIGEAGAGGSDVGASGSGGSMAAAGAAGANDGGAAGANDGGTSAGGRASGGASAGGAAFGGTASGGASSGGVGGAPNTACGSNPCQNGGTCKAGNGTNFTCSCSKRFVGARCEYRKFLAVTTWITALSHDGSTIAGQACSGNYVNCPPVKASSLGGAATPLSLPSGLPTGYMASDGCVPTALNGNGSSVFGKCPLSGPNGNTGGVEWTASSTAGKYMPGRTSAEFLTDVSSTSFDGSIVVGGMQALASGTWSAEKIYRRIPTSGIVPVDPLNAGETAYATSVSNDGLLLVGQSGGHPVRWHPSHGMTALAELPNSAPDYNQSYTPWDISADGNVIVGVFGTRGGPTALRWTESGVQSLGLGTAHGVNQDGSLVVGGSTTGACAWDATGNVQSMLDLIDDPEDTAGFQLWDALAVSDDGKVIVGNGTKGNDYFGWIARLP